MTADIPEVLFVCVHNAGRSQMAAALAASLGQGRLRVRSAGSQPADQVHPVVVEAMAELGVDLSQESPKLLAEEMVRAADFVVTMGCNDVCPVFPGRYYLDWAVEDPAGHPIETVRTIRDAIGDRVRALLEVIAAGATP